MLEIDCRKCGNCDAGADCCKIYGSNPKIAVEKCADNGFKDYGPNSGTKMDGNEKTGRTMGEEHPQLPKDTDVH